MKKKLILCAGLMLAGLQTSQVEAAGIIKRFFVGFRRYITPSRRFCPECLYSTFFHCINSSIFEILNTEPTDKETRAYSRKDMYWGLKNIEELITTDFRWNRKNLDSLINTMQILEKKLAERTGPKRARNIYKKLYREIFKYIEDGGYGSLLGYNAFTLENEPSLSSGIINKDMLIENEL